MNDDDSTGGGVATIHSRDDDETRRISGLLANYSTVTENCCFDPAAAIFSEDLKSFLRREWDCALTKCSLKADSGTTTATTSASTATVFDRWFDRLWQLHSEDPARHYHTGVHLQEMLLYFRLVLNEQRDTADAESLVMPSDETPILLAIFFHDAIYDAKSGSNEEESAALFETFAREVTLSAEPSGAVVTEKVLQYIRATQKHKVKLDNPFDLALFLDLDMAVLGKEPKAYRSYAALVRKEYAFVPRDLYCEKRSDILESFLQQQPVVYGTSLFRSAFEERARCNLRDEIDSLRRGSIYGEEVA